MSDSSSSDTSSLDQWVSEKISPRDLVVFENVHTVYPLKQDIFVTYSLGSQVEQSSRDWIGLFRIGWKTINDYITFNWVPPVRITDLTEKDKRVQSLLFRSRYLPTYSNYFELYQFIYVNKFNNVLGASRRFRICDSWPAKFPSSSSNCSISVVYSDEENDDDDGDGFQNVTVTAKKSSRKPDDVNLSNSNRLDVVEDYYACSESSSKLFKSGKRSVADVIENGRSKRRRTLHPARDRETLVHVGSGIRYEPYRFGQVNLLLESLSYPGAKERAIVPFKSVVPLYSAKKIKSSRRVHPVDSIEKISSDRRRPSYFDSKTYPKLAGSILALERQGEKTLRHQLSTVLDSVEPARARAYRRPILDWRNTSTALVPVSSSKRTCHCTTSKVNRLDKLAEKYNYAKSKQREIEMTLKMVQAEGEGKDTLIDELSQEIKKLISENRSLSHRCRKADKLNKTMSSVASKNEDFVRANDELSCEVTRLVQGMAKVRLDSDQVHEKFKALEIERDHYRNKTVRQRSRIEELLTGKAKLENYLDEILYIMKIEGYCELPTNNSLKLKALDEYLRAKHLQGKGRIRPAWSPLPDTTTEREKTCRAVRKAKDEMNETLRELHGRNSHLQLAISDANARLRNERQYQTELRDKLARVSSSYHQTLENEKLLSETIAMERRHRESLMSSHREKEGAFLDKIRTLSRTLDGITRGNSRPGTAHRLSPRTPACLLQASDSRADEIREGELAFGKLRNRKLHMTEPRTTMP